LYLEKRYEVGQQLDLSGFCRYKCHMAKQRGRPRVDPNKTRAEYLEVRLDAAEKQAFREAAELAGLAVSAWVRERLRTVAREELEKAGRVAPFLSQEKTGKIA
jgi:uncharacterized protein (DUF1778 family)